MYRLPPVSPPIGPNANGAPRSGETELRFQARRAVGVATVACGGPPATESTLKQAQKHAGAVSRVHQNARFSLRRDLRAHRHTPKSKRRRPAGHRIHSQPCPEASGSGIARSPERAFFTPTDPPSEPRTPKTGRRRLTEDFRSPKPSPINSQSGWEMPRAIPRDRQNCHFFTQIHPPRPANQLGRARKSGQARLRTTKPK